MRSCGCLAADPSTNLVLPSATKSIDCSEGSKIAISPLGMREGAWSAPSSTATHATVCPDGGSYRHFGALDALAFYVHKDNPIEKITFEQIDAIYSTTRHRGGKPIRTWGDLGATGEWACLVCSQPTYAQSLPEGIRAPAMRWLKVHAEYDDTHPWEALDIAESNPRTSPALRHPVGR